MGQEIGIGQGKPVWVWRSLYGTGESLFRAGGAPTGQPIWGREKQVMGVCKPLTRILKKEFKNPTLGKVGVNTEKLEFDVENLEFYPEYHYHVMTKPL